MKKLLLMSLILFMTIGFVISGITLAFFRDQDSVGNAMFTTGSISLTSINTFSAQDDPYSFFKYPSWIVQNTGSNDLVLRVKISCEWQDITSESSPPIHTVSMLGNSWTLEETGWYLFEKPISPREVLQIDAEIMNYDSFWEGNLNVFFEAEASDMLDASVYE